MTANLSIKNWSRRAKNAAAALLFLTAYSISAVGPFVPVVNASAGDITISGTEGQNSDGSWTPGNTTQYKEGDTVNYRFKLTSNSNANASGNMRIEFGSNNCVFFDNYFKLLSVVSTSTADVAASNNGVVGVGTPVSGNLYEDYYQELGVEFHQTGTVIVTYQIRLSLTAGECNGSSSHMSYGNATSPGDFGNIGNMTIPSPANVWTLPSITVHKQVADGTAEAKDFSVAITAPDGTTQTYPFVNDTGTTQTGTVFIDNLRQDGQYTLEETNAGGVYAMTGWSGASTNCSLGSLIARTLYADVQAGDTSNGGHGTHVKNATCTFINSVHEGSITVIKNVVNDNGGAKTYADFSFDVNNQNYSFNETTSPDGARTISLPVGTYSVTEPEANTMGYSTSYDNCANITVVANQTATCTITNDDNAPSLSVTKHAINDNGGTKQAPDFKLYVNGELQTDARKGGDVNDSAITYEYAEGKVLAGTPYTVTEDEVTGYEKVSIVCTDLGTQQTVAQPVVLQLGQKVDCTITNNDKAPSLTLKKTVVNKYGGQAVPSDWTLTATGPTIFSAPGSISGATSPNTFKAGTYTLSEAPTNSPIAGYTASAWDCGNTVVTNGQIQIGLGESVTCGITNSDTPATIFGFKYEVNSDKTQADSDGNGISGLSGWTICLDADQSGTCDSGEMTTTTAADGSYSFTGISAGTYSFLESLGGSMDGWTQIFAPQPVTVGLGGSSTGNNFGNFKNGDIHGYKWNDLDGDGHKSDGEPKLSGWTIFIDEDSDNVLDNGEAWTVTDTYGNYSFDNLAPGTYTVCEVMQNGWVQTAPGTQTKCSNRTINISGESNTLNFGNQARGTLTVIKNVDDGFGKVSQDVDGWTWNYDGSYQNGNDETANSGNAITVPADNYTVGENQQTNYHFTSVNCAKNGQAYTVTQAESFDVTVGASDAVVCTFTNTRDTANITVTKKVVNDNGGTAKVSDFNLYVNEDQVTSGTSKSFLTDTKYTVSEKAQVSGYDQTSLKCWVSGIPFVDLGNTFTLENGKDVECEIVNDDIAPQLTVYKEVYNGITNLTKTPADFTMNVDGTNVSNSSFPGDDGGTTVTLKAGGYTVSEGAHDDYDMYMEGDCDTDIAVGEHKYCHVYNEAIPDPQINVVKSGPTQAHEGDTVTYTFTVTNPGNVPFPDVQVEDDIAGAGTYVSGDTNDNYYLDPGEEWIYTADYAIPDGQVDDVHNTVTACGGYGYYEGEGERSQYNDGYETVCDTDDHTLDVLHPAVMVVKAGPINAQLGTTGTYTFTVTNTGDTPLDLTKVMDSIAGTGVYVSGDTNGDGMLDLNETWLFTADYKFNTLGSVTNVVTVCGVDSLDIETCDEDSHTTIVYQPQVLGAELEDTGIGTMAPLLLSSSLLGLAVFITFRSRSKQSVRV